MQKEIQSEWHLEANPFISNDAWRNGTDDEWLAEAELNLDGVIEFFKRHQPDIVAGSAVSMPSGLPSGWEMQKSLISKILEPFNLPDTVIDQVASNWCLEDVFDICKNYNVEIADSFLMKISGICKNIEPNYRHFAIVNYRSAHPKARIFTTNWDDLFEKAAVNMGFSVSSASNFALGNNNDKSTKTIAHIHGSFADENCVCSSIVEARGIQLPVNFLARPSFFVGYSGYEPSIHFHLLAMAPPQLWCIFNKNELKDPLKRRMLRRKNRYFYVGDMDAILEKVSKITDKRHIPPQEIEILAIQNDHLGTYCAGLHLMSRINLGFIRDYSGRFRLPPFRERMLPKLLWGKDTQIALAIDTILYRQLYEQVLNHSYDASTLRDLFQLAEDRGSPQCLLTTIALLLRHADEKMNPFSDKNLFEMINDTKRSFNNEFDTFVHSGGAIISRLQFYLMYTHDPRSVWNTKDEKDIVIQSYVIPKAAGDLNLLAESSEIYGNLFLRENRLGKAEEYYHMAATAHYLSRRNKAGFLCDDLAAQAREFSGSQISLRISNDLPPLG